MMEIWGTREHLTAMVFFTLFIMLQKVIDGGTSSYGESYTHNDIIGTCFESRNGDYQFYKNGSLRAKSPPNTFTGGYKLFFRGWVNRLAALHNALNFGQKPFKYVPPQGFLPLNSASARPNKVVPRPDQYVGVATYKGNLVQINK